MNKQALKQTFLDLIAINEVYPNEDEVITYTLDRLNNAGVQTELDSFRNIIAKIPGTGSPVLLSTHLDIPESAPDIQYILDGDIIRSDGNSILGADPKSGLAILIEFAAYLAAQDPATHAPVELLLTRGEETGLHGAINADYDKISANIGLVLDEDGPVTQVVTKAPAFGRIDATFIGKVVHPREPELGINALQAATAACQALPWGYACEGVTWNIGTFQSGTARNSVPGRAMLQAELRGFDQAKVEQQLAHIGQVFSAKAKELGATLEIEQVLEFGGYELTQDHELFVRLEKTFSEMNLTPNYFETFGGTDANIFNAKGIMSVPLGSGYYSAHQYTEYIHLGEMEEICLFLDKFTKV